MGILHFYQHLYTINHYEIQVDISPPLPSPPLSSPLLPSPLLIFSAFSFSLKKKKSTNKKVSIW